MVQLLSLDYNISTVTACGKLTRILWNALPGVETLSGRKAFKGVDALYAHERMSCWPPISGQQWENGI